MCLITVAPKGTSKNSEQLKEWIKNGFKNQKDGSGFAYKKNGTDEIYLSKAFWYPDSMIKAIVDSNLTEDDELIIHHRTSTGGSDARKNTHPFIVSDDFEEMTQLQALTKKPVMAHNGVFYGYYDLIDKTFNDTAHWIMMWEPLLADRMVDNPELFFKLYDTKINI